LSRLERLCQEYFKPISPSGPNREIDEKGNTDRLRQVARIVRMINAYFNEAELKSLAFDMGVEYDDLPNSTKKRKVEGLVRHLQRRGRLGRLATHCQELRPDIMGWPQMIDDVSWQ
jgi:hypothetical protein